jgi:serine/threonine protein kinase
MATVWLAEDRVRGARVALKILHAHLVGDASTRERLRREVMTAGLIKHEGALLAQELHELDGHLALSMPYHPGRTLAERVAAEGPIGGTALRAIGARLADVLAAAHRAGVLHRDITPANVMIDDEGVATLTDFGLARLEQWQSTRHTGRLGHRRARRPRDLRRRARRPPQRPLLLGHGAVLRRLGPGALRRAERRGLCSNASSPARSSPSRACARSCRTTSAPSSTRSCASRLKSAPKARLRSPRPFVGGSSPPRPGPAARPPKTSPAAASAATPDERHLRARASGPARGPL